MKAAFTFMRFVALACAALCFALIDHATAADGSLLALASTGVAIVTPQRALLDAIVQDCANNGFSNAVPLAGYIRADVTLGTTNQISWDIGTTANNGQAIFPTENRLRNNDAFYPTHYAVFFSTWVTATGAPARARAVLHCFGNDVVFGANAPEIAAAYNSGKLSLRVNDKVYMDSLDMLRFQYVDTAQEGLNVLAANPYMQSAWDQNQMFACIQDPLVRLNGMSSNIFTATFPDNLVFTGVAANTVSASIYLRGWLVQNAGAARTANN